MWIHSTLHYTFTLISKFYGIIDIHEFSSGTLQVLKKMGVCNKI